MRCEGPLKSEEGPFKPYVDPHECHDDAPLHGANPLPASKSRFGRRVAGEGKYRYPSPES